MVKIGKWRSNYRSSVIMVWFHFVGTVIMIFLFFILGFNRALSYSAPYQNASLIILFAIAILIVGILYFLYVTMIEKYREFLEIYFWKIPKNKIDLCKSLVAETLENTIHSLDHNNTKNDNVELKLKGSSIGWNLKNKKIKIYLIEYSRVVSICVYPTYSKNAEATKITIYNNLKKAITKYTQI